MLQLTPPMIREREGPPERIKVACNLVFHLGQTLDPKFVQDNGMTQQLEPRKLEVEESQLLAEATRLIVAYLQGGYKEDQVERSKRARRKQKQEEWTFLNCINCGGVGKMFNSTCRVCRGTGSLKCQPANPKGT